MFQWTARAEQASEAGDLAAARAEWDRALAVARRLSDADPGDVMHRQNVLGIRSSIAKLLEHHGDTAGARAMFEALIPEIVQFAESVPNHAEIQGGAARAYASLAAVQAADGDPDAAYASYRTSVDRWQRVLRATPTFELREGYVETLLDLSKFLVQHRSATVAQVYEEARRVGEAMVAQAPDNPNAKLQLLLVYSGMVDLMGRREHAARAGELIQQLRTAGVLTAAEAAEFNREIAAQVREPPP